MSIVRFYWFISRPAVCLHLSKQDGQELAAQDFYDQAMEDEKPDGIIPSGAVFQALLSNGIEKVHRDTFHASLGLGRYALGMIWYKVLTGNDIGGNNFAKFNEEVTLEQIAIAKKSVEEVYSRYYT